MLRKLIHPSIFYLNTENSKTLITPINEKFFFQLAPNLRLGERTAEIHRRDNGTTGQEVPTCTIYYLSVFNKVSFIWQDFQYSLLM